jgi:peptide-methionine (S)-S-oxide reductase
LSQKTAVLAGGCFWCVEAVFQRIAGVEKVVSGYANGDAVSAHCEIVSTGETGHAESVQITYDSGKISYGQLLKVFFSVAHDPTQLNRQRADVGPQYRSAVFYSTPEQREIAAAYIGQLDQAKVFHKPIVTQVVELKGFYPAEAHHQNFCNRNPWNPYVMSVAMPKVLAVMAAQVVAPPLWKAEHLLASTGVAAAAPGAGTFALTELFPRP